MKPLLNQRRVIRALALIHQLVHDALYQDGDHHKQWYLHQIEEALGLEKDEDAEPGIPP